VYEGHDTPVM